VVVMTDTVLSETMRKESARPAPVLIMYQMVSPMMTVSTILAWAFT
jgi:hypothetical protein